MPIKSARAFQRSRQWQRRHRITQAYLGGASLDQVARRFGIARNSLAVNLARWGVKLPAEERRARQVANAVAMAARSKGRPPIWPDCPEHLQEDYALLRTCMSAGEARAMLEARA